MLMRRLLSVAFALLLSSAAARAAVTIDATGSEGFTSLTTSANYTGLTISSGLSHGALVCMATFDGNVSAASMTWDSGGTNQALTRLIDQTNADNSHATVWGLLSPTAGNKTLHAAWTTTSSISVACASVQGAAAFTNATGAMTSASNTLSFNVTSAIGDLVFGSWVETTAGTISSLNGTTIFTDNVNGNANAGANYASGAASVTMTMNTSSASGNNGGAAVDVVAAAASASGGLLLMGVGN